MAATKLDWQTIIAQAIAAEVSDIHLTAGQPIFFRRQGEMVPFGTLAPDEGFMEDFLRRLLAPADLSRFHEEREGDFSWVFNNRRFRVNAYWQHGQPALALRLVPARIPTLEEIGAPPALKNLLALACGLILVCGSTGMGKTTTLASFLQAVNRERAAHIITLEDPIEYLLVPERAFISQRELGRDFLAFKAALRGAVRAMPDILLVGELRDAQTVRAALNAAEAGILVLGTLHTNNAAEAALRLESLFAVSEQTQLRLQLSLVLAGVFSQRLLPKATSGRVCATEVLLATPAVRNLLRQGKYEQLPTAMLSGGRAGMQTFAQAVRRLYEQGVIAPGIYERYKGTGTIE